MEQIHKVGSSILVRKYGTNIAVLVPRTFTHKPTCLLTIRGTRRTIMTTATTITTTTTAITTTTTLQRTVTPTQTTHMIPISLHLMKVKLHHMKVKHSLMMANLHPTMASHTRSKKVHYLLLGLELVQDLVMVAVQKQGMKMILERVQEQVQVVLEVQKVPEVIGI